jgi:hypothetical protein
MGCFVVCVLGVPRLARDRERHRERDKERDKENLLEMKLAYLGFQGVAWSAFQCDSRTICAKDARRPSVIHLIVNKPVSLSLSLSVR